MSFWQDLQQKSFNQDSWRCQSYVYGLSGVFLCGACLENIDPNVSPSLSESCMCWSKVRGIYLYTTVSFSQLPAMLAKMIMMIPAKMKSQCNIVT
jgi:hypothetical protein